MNASHIDWDAGHDHSHSNAIVQLHRLLRGKYVIALILAVLFGVIGGGIGYMSQSPQYRSTGVIRIQPSLPKVLYESEQSTAPKMFSSFVNSQAELISNGRVIQNAIESDDWRQIRGLTEIDSVREVQEGLNVRTSRSAQEIITVSFSDRNPRVSAVIVGAVMKSYYEQYGKEGSINNPEILNALNERKTDLLGDRKAIDSQIANITAKHRTEDLSPLIQNNQFTMRQLEMQMMKLVNQSNRYEEFSKQNTSAESSEMTVEQAAEEDPVISELLARRLELSTSRDEMMAAEGLREEHRDVRRLTGMIDSVQSRIDKRLEELKDGNITSTLVDENGMVIPSKSAIESRIARIDTQLKDTQEKAAVLYSANMQLNTLREDRALLQSSIAQVNDRLDLIQTESKLEDMEQISGKISIPILPTPSKEPTSDPRVKFGIMGFVGTGSIPIFAILALSYFSHRIQYSDDTILSSTGAGVIGMLPDLGDSLADKDLAAASAFAIHQIRSQLQIKNRLGEGRVYSVTSPAPQDGKTSLIIAMGLSYAESGNRTLLVDLDFIGRGLSVHFGHPNAPSLADSLESPDQIDAMIQDTEFEGLNILPAGFGDDERVSRLSPRSIGALVQHLREDFDTVLFDSGPILGSVEAAFVAPQTDGVLLVVGRGQHKPLVKKAIEQIHSVDGQIVATIFNRASIQELRQSSSSMSVHFSRQMSRQQDILSSRPGLRIGPVAGALFSSRPDRAVATPEKSMDQ